MKDGRQGDFHILQFFQIKLQSSVALEPFKTEADLKRSEGHRVNGGDGRRDVSDAEIHALGTFCLTREDLGNGGQRDGRNACRTENLAHCVERQRGLAGFGAQGGIVHFGSNIVNSEIEVGRAIFNEVVLVRGVQFDRFIHAENVVEINLFNVSHGDRQSVGTQPHGEVKVFGEVIGIVHARCRQECRTGAEGSYEEKLFDLDRCHIYLF